MKSTVFPYYRTVPAFDDYLVVDPLALVPRRVHTPISSKISSRIRHFGNRARRGTDRLVLPCFGTLINGTVVPADQKREIDKSLDLRAGRVGKLEGG